ncbi:hypothetical protein M0811_01532 [Anaeramoeba ignava]|uniref:F-box domain-containing protein n=1 Tax=Anaeramoeba ignava TaxID=1746090 RepID=A0A9Q0LGP8_ANAIG|nr:hypothetical protein M0811_01532 [Anaeramoeba ignava]
MEQLLIQKLKEKKAIDDFNFSKIRETNQFTIQKFGDKLKAKITNDNFNFLKIGEMSKVPTKLKKPSKQENLFIEMLPEDVHLYIFQFLSPGSLLKLSMTCKTFNDLSKDINCWRNISFKYWRYFLLKDLEIQNYPYYSDPYYTHQPNTGNNEYEKNPIYGIIEKPEITNQFRNSNLQSIMDKKPQKLIRRQSSISLLAERLKKLQETRNKHYGFPENEYRSYMMRYIESTPNPKNELISKSKSIYRKMKERKEIFEKINRKNLIPQKIDNWINSNILFSGLCLITFLILLGFYVDRNLSFNPFYLFILLLIPTFIFSILFLFQSFYDYSNSRVFDLIIPLLSFAIFIQVLLIGLKSGKIIQYSWLLIFSPIFILSGILIFFSIIFCCLSIIFLIPGFGFMMVCLFFILLGLKLDGIIELSYGIICIPLFLFYFIPCLFSLCLGGLFFIIGFIFILIPLFISQILLIRYLGNSNHKSLSFTFIPFYISFSGIFCVILCLNSLSHSRFY